MSKSKMPLVYNNPDHWHARAEDARAMADRMLDPDARARMQVIAEQYDKITERAVERRKALAQGRRPLVDTD